MQPCLAIDWGTSNRRVILLEADGAAREVARDARGVLAIATDGYAAEVEALRARFGPLPVVAAGMVGSTRGWRAVPYIAAPAGLIDLAAGAVRIAEADVLLLPGLAQQEAGRADVMRGEETQVLGAHAAGLLPDDALVCQPGTHTKWITLSAGRIVDFASALTGELFALLRDRSTLAEFLAGPVADDAAFHDGVLAGARGPLLDQLFHVRAAVLLGQLPAADAAARASGVLIGADVVARAAAGRVVHILADGPLATLYARAVALTGGEPVLADPQVGFAAGIHRLRALLK